MPRARQADYFQSFRFALVDLTGGSNVFEADISGQVDEYGIRNPKYLGLARLLGIEQSLNVEDISPLNFTYDIAYPFKVVGASITLMKGLKLQSKAFFDWIVGVITGKTTIRPLRRTIGAAVLSSDGLVYNAKVYKFFHCIPVRYSLDDLDAQTPDILLESLELRFAYLEVGTVNNLMSVPTKFRPSPIGTFIPI